MPAARVDDRALRAWFGDYLTWMTTSVSGRAESAYPNDIGSWYDAEVLAVALALRDTRTARRAGGSLRTRIASQIGPDGRQPLELARATPLAYSVFNLAALCRGAALASRLGIDLWDPNVSGGASIRSALEYLLPSLSGGPLPGATTTDTVAPADVTDLLVRAFAHYRDPAERVTLDTVIGMAWRTAPLTLAVDVGS